MTQQPALQGIHPRRGRPDRRLPPPLLQKAAEIRPVPEPQVPGAQALPAAGGGSHGVCGASAQAARHSRRQKGVCPLGHPLRLPATPTPTPTFLQELVQHHISGQLKVAPEHCVNHVLDKMGKPHIQVFDRFCKRFYEETKRIGKEQYLVPYLMSSHPGCTIAGRGGAGALLKAPPHASRAGAGLLPYPRHRLHLYVLHRP